MYGNPGDPGGVAMTSVLANANRVIGAVVRVEREAFETILHHAPEPVLVHAPAGLFGSAHQYVTSYRGLTFYTKCSERLRIPPQAEVIEAKSMSIPM